MNLKDWLNQQKNRAVGAVRSVGRAVQGAGRATGRAAATAGRGAMAVNPFDPRNTDRAGRALGNVLSRNQRVAGIVNAIGDRGGLAAARAVRDMTGVGGFQRGATKAQQGDIRGALLSAAGGAGQLGLSATGVGRGVGLTGRFATQGAYQTARAAGRGVAPSIARAAGTAVFGDPASAALRRAAVGRGVLARGGAAAAGLALPGSIFERGVLAPLVDRGLDRFFGPAGQTAGQTAAATGPASRTASQGDTFTDADGRVYRRNPLTGQNEVVGWNPQSVKAPFYDKEGRYHVWNPTMGIYNVEGWGRPGQQTTPGGAGTPATPVSPETPADGGAAQGGAFTVPGEDLGAGMFGALPYEDGYTTMSGLSRGAGGPAGYSEELAALSPEEMQELLEASREAQRQYDEIINQIGRTTAETERDFFDYTRGVNRQVAGGRQNVASQLAQLGMDTSPATQAYAEYLGAQGQRQIAGGRAKVADILADLRGQRGTAEANKLRRLRELDMAMRNARARRTVNRVQY